MGYSRVLCEAERLFSGGRRSFVSRSLGGLLGRSLLGLFATGEDLGDPHNGIVLAMPALAARILATALLEGNDLLAAGVFHHFACHGHALDEGGADLGAAVVGDHENLVERDGGARLACERGDGDDVVGGNAILLAAGLDHCEHLAPRVQTQFSAGTTPPDWLFGSFRLRFTTGLKLPHGYAQARVPAHRGRLPTGDPGLCQPKTL